MLDHRNAGFLTAVLWSIPLFLISQTRLPAVSLLSAESLPRVIAVMISRSSILKIMRMIRAQMRIDSRVAKRLYK